MRLAPPAALFLLLAACASSAPPPPPRDPLASIPEQRLAVAYVDVAEAWPPPTAGTFIDRRRTDELAAATRRYLEQKVQASGGAASARASIVQVGVIEVREENVSWGTTVTNPPDTTLRGLVEVKVAIVRPDGQEAGYATAKVERARTMRNLTSVLEREAMAQELIANLLVELDQALSRSVNENLGEYLRL